MAPGPSFSTFLTHFFPPKPEFTDKDVPDLTGKVCVVTGSNTGIGKHVARFLYTKNAKVYLACRSEEKALKAIESIRTDQACARSSGELIFLPLDLSDLPNTKTAAETLVEKEQKIHLLFNNAGVMVGPGEPIPRTNQGYELGLGVNCLATFLFTQLLTPTLAATAKAEQQPNTVRVIWLSSFGLNLFASEGVGVSMDNLDFHKPQGHTERYGLSKTGAWALGVEYARRHSRSDGIVSVPIDPGNLRSELPRDQGIVLKIVATLLGYPVVNGAYTELYAAFSPDVTVESDWSQEWVIPWGRFRALRPDLPSATKTEAEGGTGGVSKFWDWCEEQTVVVQIAAGSTATSQLPLLVSGNVPVPSLTSSDHVLVRVCAVALNPTDHKFVTHFTQPGGLVGCDFCGIVVDVGSAVAAVGRISKGDRVCGAVFPYGNGNDTDGEVRSGCFAQWLVADARVLLRVPDSWSDLEGAALGGIGWGTVGLALSAPDALSLSGLPSQPADVDEKDGDREPVLVYGAATATGTMGCQLLKLSGYLPLAVTSPQSAGLALEYGAAATALYTSPTCADDIRTGLTRPGLPIRHVLDCITSPDSATTCLAAMARTGGRYACLERMPAAWRTRKAVRVKEVAAYEGLGRRVWLGPAPTKAHDGDVDQSVEATYSREANPVLFDITQRWTREVQALLDKGLLKPHPVREVINGDNWGSRIVNGLVELQNGAVRGQKLTVRVSQC